MKQFKDDFFDWAIVDIEYCLGASKPTKKPNKVKQKNGNEIFFKNEIYERKRLCDGGFYTQRIFKTAIAKPML